MPDAAARMPDVRSARRRAGRADLAHALYERAVQSPERDADTLAALFRAHARARRAPRTLREDFCGSARIAIAWVGADDDREALGVDLDRHALARARRLARESLDDEERERLVLRRGDVRSPSDRTFDLVVAPNFSWAILHDDADLLAYFRGARAALAPDGLLVLELFGGADLRRPLVHRHAHPGFTYVWEQRSFDPERSLLDAHIHFEIEGGRSLQSAFSYVFRLRPLAALRALLARASFDPATLLVETPRGALRAHAREPTRRPSWNGYLVARPARAQRAAT